MDTPAAAFSVEQLEPGWLDEAAPILRAMVGHVIERGLPRHSILNVNLPDRPLAEITGIRPARLGGASAYDYVVARRRSDGAAPAEHYLPCDHPASGEWVETDFDVVASRRRRRHAAALRPAGPRAADRPGRLGPRPGAAP